jgi:hypothetical protein
MMTIPFDDIIRAYNELKDDRGFANLLVPDDSSDMSLPKYFNMSYDEFLSALREYKGTKLWFSIMPGRVRQKIKIGLIDEHGNILDYENEDDNMTKKKLDKFETKLAEMGHSNPALGGASVLADMQRYACGYRKTKGMSDDEVIERLENLGYQRPEIESLDPVMRRTKLAELDG